MKENDCSWETAKAAVSYQASLVPEGIPLTPERTTTVEQLRAIPDHKKLLETYYWSTLRPDYESWVEAATDELFRRSAGRFTRQQSESAVRGGHFPKQYTAAEADRAAVMCHND